MRTMRIHERIKAWPRVWFEFIWFWPWVFVSVHSVSNTVLDWFSFFNADLAVNHTNIAITGIYFINIHFGRKNEVADILCECRCSVLTLSALTCFRRKHMKFDYVKFDCMHHLNCECAKPDAICFCIKNFFLLNQFYFASNVEKSILHSPFEHSLAQIHISKHKLNFLSRFTTYFE